MDNITLDNTSELQFGLGDREYGDDGGDETGGKSFFDKLSAFFNNKWTRRGFSLISIGYLAFLVWLAWLTFAYYLVYDNAVALFILYSFANVLFIAGMIYTRKNLITKLCTLFLHPLIVVMLIYGFGDWYLLIPPFVATTVIFFASGMNESLKVILGTTYMIMIVLAILAYITLAQLRFPIPLKMDMSLRYEPQIAVAYNAATFDFSENGGNPPFRLIAYVDTERQNPTVNFFVERTDLDARYWNFTAQRTFQSVRLRNTSYMRTVPNSPEGEQLIIWEIPHAIEWRAPNLLWIDGQLIEISEDGELITDNLGTQTEEPAATYRPPPSMDDVTATTTTA
jgi:hypothetical protein